jgi:hypothetical protein
MKRQYMEIGKYSVKRSFVCLVLLAVLIPTVLASLWISKPIPSSITITGSVSANLYSNEACTIPLTAIDFGSIDKLDLNYHQSAIFYLKYNGSDTITSDFTIIHVGLPSGFVCQWKWISGSNPWRDLGITENTSFNYGKIISLQLQIKQTVEHAKDTYSFSFTVQIGV